MTQPFVLSLYFDDVRKLGLHGAVGLGAGIAAAVALQLTCGLYFWNEDQQQALGLIALTVALPLGAACGGQGRHTLMRGLCAGLGLALGAVATGGFFVQALSWFGAAALLGAGCCGIGRRAGVAASLLWLTLAALPFFYERLAATPLGGTARERGAQGAAWLGFAQYVYAADPLHKTILYFNQMTGLSNVASIEPLDASRLWILAALAMVAALWRPGRAA